METKKKKKLWNLIMVLLILVIAASGLAAVGMVQGWFGEKDESPLACGMVKGVVNIERNGLGYTLKKNTAMSAGDTVETKKGAQAQFILKETGTIALNGSTELRFSACFADETGIEVIQGEVFGDTFGYGGKFEAVFGGNAAQLSDAVFSVSVQTGSSSLNVYAGDISVTLADGTIERVEAGEYLSVITGADDSLSYSVEKLQAASLNEFLISQARNCGSAGNLCFEDLEFQSVLDAREEEKKAALEEALRSESAIPAGSETEAADDISLERESNDETGADVKAGREGSDNLAEAPGTVEEYLPDGGNASSQEEEVSEAKICTIEIRCDTILNNMGNLSDGKEAYVPGNGVILETSPVEFQDGETVFDILKRVCDYAGIQLEYSWTPVYNSYYIEGINHLYEFDCGNESGWMYKVNGWFPNYGCSAYDLQDGDVIVWCYTCNGLGADVGGPVY